jgi:hypothetical protein
VNAGVKYSKPFENLNYPYKLVIDDETVFPPEEEKTNDGPVVYNFVTFSNITSGQQDRKSVDIGGIIINVSGDSTFVHEEDGNEHDYWVVTLVDEGGDKIRLRFWTHANTRDNSW